MGYLQRVLFSRTKSKRRTRIIEASKREVKKRKEKRECQEESLYLRDGNYWKDLRKVSYKH